MTARSLLDRAGRKARRVLRRAVGVGAPSLEDIWTKRYTEAAGPADFRWHADHVPAQLLDLLGSGLVPAGRALDLGSGPGVSTAHLAATCPTVGLDIAASAMPIARACAERAGVMAEFVVAGAPNLPFADASFTLVFDRGCLHVLDPTEWPRYLNEATRVLAAGGVLQLLERRFDDGVLEALLGLDWELLTHEPFDFGDRDGGTIPMVDVRLRRRV